MSYDTNIKGEFSSENFQNIIEKMKFMLAKIISTEELEIWSSAFQKKKVVNPLISANGGRTFKI